MSRWGGLGGINQILGGMKEEKAGWGFTLQGRRKEVWPETRRCHKHQQDEGLEPEERLKLAGRKGRRGGGDPGDGSEKELGMFFSASRDFLSTTFSAVTPTPLFLLCFVFWPNLGPWDEKILPENLDTQW